MLDHERGQMYREAFQFADARSVHIVPAARTLVRGRPDWTCARGAELVDLSQRLSAFAVGLRITQVPDTQTIKEPPPMVAGIKTFA